MSLQFCNDLGQSFLTRIGEFQDRRVLAVFVEADKQARAVLEVSGKIRLVVCLPLLAFRPDVFTIQLEVPVGHASTERLEQTDTDLRLGGLCGFKVVVKRLDFLTLNEKQLIDVVEGNRVVS